MRGASFDTRPRSDNHALMDYHGAWYDGDTKWIFRFTDIVIVVILDDKQ